MGSQRVGHDWVTFTHLFICDYTESTLLPNFFFFFFLTMSHSLWDLSSHTLIKLWPSTVKMQSPNHWTTRNVFSCFSCDWLVANPWTEEPFRLGFSQQEYWSRLHFLLEGGLSEISLAKFHIILSPVKLLNDCLVPNDVLRTMNAV